MIEGKSHLQKDNKMNIQLLICLQYDKRSIHTYNFRLFFYCQLETSENSLFWCGPCKSKLDDKKSFVLFPGVSLPCSAGYICLQGSDISNPADNVKGYICPVGHYCLEGAVKETKCDIGTYGPTEGLGKGLW